LYLPVGAACLARHHNIAERLSCTITNIVPYMIQPESLVEATDRALEQSNIYKGASTRQRGIPPSYKSDEALEIYLLVDVFAR
jgi:hypothetical protein